jgi:N-methylhydantoinase A
VFVNARVAAIGIVPQGASVSRGAAAVSACAPSGKRNAFFGAWKEVPVYAADMLKPGHAIEGLAIVEAETTTVVVNAGDRITVNDLGWLDIALA